MKTFHSFLKGPRFPTRERINSLSPRPVGRSKEAMTGVGVKAEVGSSGFTFRLIWAKFPDLRCVSYIDTGQVHVFLWKMGLRQPLTRRCHRDSVRLCTASLEHGSPTPGSSPWPVRNRAAQLEVSGGWASFIFLSSRSPSLPLLPELRILSDQRRRPRH